MRIVNYKARLDNGQTMGICGARNDSHALEIAERSLGKPGSKYESAKSVESVSRVKSDLLRGIRAN
ncbi:hypothetical protein [Streptomyces sp. NPDC005732]|uniref:hypothetical protein n=1 Tax=Streptomyces sp. NPDC005732 TaxID=3157057 RepID=UPI0033DEEA16